VLNHLLLLVGIKTVRLLTGDRRWWPVERLAFFCCLAQPCLERFFMQGRLIIPHRRV